MVDVITWEEIKKKKEKDLEEVLRLFLGKLEKIRSNRISLEIIRGLVINYEGQNSTLKSLANLSTSSSRELVVQAFEPKAVSAIIKKILDEQIGYKLERSNGKEICFSLLPMTEETRKKLIKNVEEITEEGKIALRPIREKIRNLIKSSSFSLDEKKRYEIETDNLIKYYQNRLVSAKDKKTQELSLR